MPEVTLQYVFLFIFVLTAGVTLLGITKIVPIDEFYLKGLFGALLLQLISVVIIAGKGALRPGGTIERYNWQIIYPANLRESFEKHYLSTPHFAAFYERNKGKEQSAIEQSAIQDDAVSTIERKDFLDLLFVIKKAGEFAGNRAYGDMFLIRQYPGKNEGVAVLTFPNETQLIAFKVTSDPELNRRWHLSFQQPDRFVEHEGRRNKWKGGDLELDFTHLGRGEEWEGELHWEGIYVGKFYLDWKKK